MLNLFVSGTNVKHLMNLLLKGEAFDFFETRSVSVAGFVRLDIDGANGATDAAVANGSAAANGADGVNGANNTAGYVTWSELRPYIAGFIKGRPRPAHIKAVFSAPKNLLAEIAPNYAAAFLNMEYKDGEVRFLTATSQKVFTLDKNRDKNWDEFARGFFARNGVVTREEP